MRILIAFLALIVAAPAFAAKPTFPTLTVKEQQALEDGDLVLRKQDDGDQSGQITGIQRIEASSADVWKILLAFDRIPESNDSIKVAEDYTATMGRTPPAGGRFVDIHYELSVAGTSIEYNVHHTQYAAQDYLEWVLDEDKDNGIDATDGSFSTWPVPGDSSQCYFLYITRIDTGRSVPGWVETLLTKTSLKGYLKFVKREAEK
jgi:hypothetical protein